MKIYKLVLISPPEAKRLRCATFFYGGATEAKRKGKLMLRDSEPGTEAMVVEIVTTETPKKLALAILQHRDWGRERTIWSDEKPIEEDLESCPGCLAPTPFDCVCDTESGGDSAE